MGESQRHLLHHDNLGLRHGLYGSAPTSRGDRGPAIHLALCRPRLRQRERETGGCFLGSVSKHGRTRANADDRRNVVWIEAASVRRERACAVPFARERTRTRTSTTGGETEGKGKRGEGEGTRGSAVQHRVADVRGDGDERGYGTRWPSTVAVVGRRSCKERVQVARFGERVARDWVVAVYVISLVVMRSSLNMESDGKDAWETIGWLVGALQRSH